MNVSAKPYETGFTWSVAEMTAFASYGASRRKPKITVKGKDVF